MSNSAEQTVRWRGRLGGGYGWTDDDRIEELTLDRRPDLHGAEFKPPDDNL